MPTLIDGYRNLPGAHCGSSAMRNLIEHYCGLDLSEAMIFGLGSGLDLLFMEGESLEPQVTFFGRTSTLEMDVASALGVDYREQPDFDDERAWQAVREEVSAGRPTMLSGDVFYLDYRDFKVHFPAHRFVLLGFDDARQKAFVADRLRPEIEEVSYGALAESRNPRGYPMSTYNLWGRFHGTEASRSVAEACRFALRRNARRMLGADTSQANLLRMIAGRTKLAVCETGLEGLRRFVASVPTWFERADRKALMHFGGTNIESYGTGGGNFRRLFGDFLVEAQALLPEVDETLIACARESAELWTALAGVMQGAVEGSTPEVPVEGMLTGILDRETRLFESLGARFG